MLVYFIQKMSSNLIVSLLTDKTLTGDNFPKWKTNINIILITKNIRFVLTEERPQDPSPSVTQRSQDSYDRWIAANNKAKEYMLASISITIRIKMKDKDTTYEIMDVLQQIFRQQSEQARYDIVRKYTNTRMRSSTQSGIM